MIWPFLLVASLWPAPAAVGASSATPGSLALDDDTALFVVGNTLFTVYHELGHALIDLLNLPVIGREEDAVDGFAAVMMIPAEPDPVRDELIIAVADAWRMQSVAGDNPLDPAPLWGEHALDEQRHFAIVCLMVGSDPDGFHDFAVEAGLPLERISRCQEDFQRMESGWDRLLVRYRPGDEAPVTDAPITVVFDAPGPDEQEAFALARQGDTITKAIAALDASLVLPETASVRFTRCDEANAYWVRSRREVRICYALVGDFLSILQGADSG